ncbi:MAG TPA: heme-binding protein [Terriglobia bacterium]|nr:heme-binding protein [Terriglobia bacterium]
MLGTTRYLTLKGARKMMDAAEAEAGKHGWNVAIAIVDAAANLILFERLDDTQPGSIDVALGKARTAANFKRPTKALEDLVLSGRTMFLAIDGVAPMQGGVPVVVDGKVVGAVGVSGVTAAQDEQVALAAVSALSGGAAPEAR